MSCCCISLSSVFQNSFFLLHLWTEEEHQLMNVYHICRRTNTNMVRTIMLVGVFLKIAGNPACATPSTKNPPNLHVESSFGPPTPSLPHSLLAPNPGRKQLADLIAAFIIANVQIVHQTRFHPVLIRFSRADPCSVGFGRKAPKR